METRGFGVGPRTYLHQTTFRSIDWLVCTGMVLAGIAGIMLKDLV